MVAVYEKHGIQFMYPENWSLSEEDTSWPREVSVESPGGGFWALHLYSPPEDAQRLTDDVLDAMRAEYDPVESEEVEEQVAGVTAVGHDLTFFYLDLLITCRVRGFTLGDKTFVLITQAEDRDYQQLAPVFQAMTVNLVENQAG